MYECFGVLTSIIYDYIQYFYLFTKYIIVDKELLNHVIISIQKYRNKTTNLCTFDGEHQGKLSKTITHI